MTASDLERLARQLAGGELGVDEFLQRASKTVAANPLSDRHVTLDLDRARRAGFPEVIYGQGKTPQTVKAIAEQLVANDLAVLATRLSEETGSLLLESFPEGVWNKTARTFRLSKATPDSGKAAEVVVVTAGTSDQPVAEEAIETLHWMDVACDSISDVGVAGPHRLVEQVERLRNKLAVIVVAGMEGALPSVVGGYVDCPVFAVPTSIGYGASFGGVSALLGMLNSCASNVAVVNIDAGFRAGYLAGMIVRQRNRQNIE